MLSLTGQLMNVIPMPKGTGKDGSAYGGGFKVQIMCQNQLQNGETKLELVDLKADDDTPFKGLVGKRIVVPVGAFAKGAPITFYLPKTGDTADIRQAD